jgi:hypothetical protein
MIQIYDIIHASTQHQLDNNIHVPMNHNKNQEYDENNNNTNKIIMKIIQQNNLIKKR